MKKILIALAVLVIAVGGFTYWTWRDAMDPVFDVTKIKVGEYAGGLKVISVGAFENKWDISESNARIEFEGPLTLKGTYAIYDMNGPTLELDEDEVGTLPAAGYPVKAFCIDNYKDLPETIKPGDHIEMTLNSYVVAIYPVDGCIAGQYFMSVKEL